jgi:hypothetical protein
MKKFDYKILTEISLPNKIVNQLTMIHEYRGKQELYLRTKTELLKSLLR